VTQNLVENFNVGILTGRVWTLDPHQVPPFGLNELMFSSIFGVIDS
jgi:hypothetical protein